MFATVKTTNRADDMSLMDVHGPVEALVTIGSATVYLLADRATGDGTVAPSRTGLVYDEFSLDREMDDYIDATGAAEYPDWPTLAAFIAVRFLAD